MERRISEIHISFALIEMILKNRENGYFTLIVIPNDFEIIATSDNKDLWHINSDSANVAIIFGKSLEFPIIPDGQMSPVYTVMAHEFLYEEKYQTAKWILWLGQTFGAKQRAH